MAWGFWVPPGSGCAVLTTCFLGRLAQEDRLTTGAAGVVFCVYVCVFFSDDFFLELDELALSIGFAQLRTFFKVLPPLFCRLFFGYFWPSGVFFFSSSSGWVGSPCCVFPAFSPVSRVGGGCVLCFLLCTLASCVFSVGLG